MNTIDIPSNKEFSISEMIERANVNMTRRNVIAFEKLMERGQKVEIKIDNYYSDGVYGRRAYIPAGTILTGKIHKFEQMNILLKGEIEVLVNNEIKHLVAPQIIVSPPGMKRLARALSDVEWLTILRTDLLDADLIETQFTCATEEEYLKYLEQEPQLSLFKEGQ